jgi:hypothetical protein
LFLATILYEITVSVTVGFGKVVKLVRVAVVVKKSVVVTVVCTSGRVDVVRIC